MWANNRFFPTPQTPDEVQYLQDYVQKWGSPPPLPFPKNQKQVQDLDAFMKKYTLDLRVNGLPPPDNDEQLNYAYAYMDKWNAPPPAYPKTEDESAAIDQYIRDFGTDPRILYAQGMPIWSIWLHVIDPDTMIVLHWLIVATAFLFTIGFCTRVTSALTWFGSLCYIHRNPTNLFGVDTMMTILLLYLMIGPSGAVFSVDALIRRWWARAKPGVVQAWCRFWKAPVPENVAPATSPEAKPSVSANVAIRLLQVHVCIIYLVAGLSKLQGPSWWNGGALWLTLGNYEFAPMQFELYMKFLRLLGSHQWLYDGFMFGGGIFTLAFEIGYAFLIWRPKLRWLFLGAAILLHGFIGLFMGLKTFSLMMLVMNMAFLRKEEVLWFFGWFSPSAATSTVKMAATPEPAKQPAVLATSAIKK
jgi:hypothetical protein